MGVDHVFGAAFVFHAEFGAVAAVVEGGNGFAETHFGAGFDSGVDQNLVETVALDVKGMAGAGGGFFVEIEAGVALAPGKGGAVFVLEADAVLHRVGHAGFFQNLDGVRQQALADNEARKVLFFQYADMVAAAGKQGGGNCT